MKTVNVNIKTDFANWNQLFKDKQWLAQHSNKEAKWLEVLINELWHNKAIIIWDMICEQKAWLQSHTDDAAKRLEDFIEQLQDAGVDSEEYLVEEIYGELSKKMSSSWQEATNKPTHLKLVVKNYFQPRERIDQPPKPEPVLTLV